MSETPLRPSIADSQDSESDTYGNSLAVQQHSELQNPQSPDAIHPYFQFWRQAWFEFQRSGLYRWIKTSSKLTVFVLLSVFGLSLIAIAQFMIPLLALYGWIIVAVSSVLAVHILASHFFNKFHQRAIAEIETKYQNENTALRALLQSRSAVQLLPHIVVKVIEAFIHPETSLCFVNFCLHNDSPTDCDLPPDIQAYSLSLKLKGSEKIYDKHRLVDVFGRYYLSMFEDDIAYSEEGYEYETTQEVGKELLLPTKKTLSRGRPLYRWLGFQLRGLPSWPTREEPIGQHEEVHFDEESGDVDCEWVTDYVVTKLTSNVEAITLTVTDPFGNPHSGSIVVPFHEYGRRVVKVPNADT